MKKKTYRAYIRKHLSALLFSLIFAKLEKKFGRHDSHASIIEEISHGISSKSYTTLGKVEADDLEDHPEVKFLICEAPFDSFSAQMRRLTGKANSNSWRYLAANRFLKYVVPAAQNLEEINPLSALPDKLSLKLLLLHGTADFTTS
ncbi:15619_t:CDS:2 [Entrophospora sp. SA101]|nr:15619_t:CDS:2 [Entrophospora sp. SA101]